jgi:hypothetical protein
VQFDALWLNT